MSPHCRDDRAWRVRVDALKRLRLRKAGIAAVTREATAVEKELLGGLRRGTGQGGLANSCAGDPEKYFVTPIEDGDVRGKANDADVAKHIALR